MTPLDKKLHKIITDLLPEILELKFGCSFVEDGEEFICVGYLVEAICDVVIDEYGDRHYVKDIEEIIGTPIGIAEVLLALGDNENLEIKDAFYVSFYGELVNFKTKKVVGEWDLTKDLFSQTEELKKYLLDILK